MENSKNTRKQEKQKMVIRTGGGGGGGAVVVWGGVVAIAALASISAINKLRKRPANKSQNPPPLISSTVESEKLELNNNDNQGKDVSALPQDSSPPEDCHYPRDGITDMAATQLIDSKSSEPTKCLILDDDNPLLDINVQSESREEGLNEEVTPQARAEDKGIEAASGDLFAKAFMTNTTEMDKQVMETATLMNQRANPELEAKEVVIKEEEEEDDKAVEATRPGDQSEAVDNRDDNVIQSIEETNARKYDEDNEIAEKGEESSVERFEDNSQLVMTFTEKATDDENEGGKNDEGEMMEKGEEESKAIWPAQLVEELPVMEHREMKINQQTLEEREDGDTKVKKEKRSCSSCDNNNVNDIYHANGNSHHYNQVKGKPAIKITSLKEVMMRSIFIDPSDLRVWIWSTSVLLLLLVAHLLLLQRRNV